MDENQIGSQVVDTAIALHRDLGPGLLESVYEVLLADELQRRGLQVARQQRVALTYKGRYFEECFRADLVINDRVIVELKAVEAITKSHHKQLLTYLKLTGMKLGFLLNFSEATMKQGIKRIVNGLPD